MTSRIGNSFVQLDTSSAVLIAAGVVRPGIAIDGDGDEVKPVTESLSGLPFELLLAGRGEDCIGEFGSRRKYSTSVRMVKCWATVAMMLRVRKKIY